MDGHKVGLKLTIRVGEDSFQSRDELCGAAFVWTQEKPLLVVIIGMNVVPDDRGSSQDFGHLLNRLYCDIFGHYLGT